MTEHQNISTLQTRFSIIITIFVVIILACGTSITSYLFLQQLKSTLIQDAVYRANEIAIHTADNLQDQDKLKETIAKYQTISDVNFVYIFNIRDGKYTPLAEFKKDNQTGILNRIQQVENFTNPSLINNIIEYSHPIHIDNKVMGYVYLQISAESYLSFNKTLKITLLIMSVLIILVGLFLSKRLQSAVTGPINELTYRVQQISKKRNYSQRIEQMPYQELDILARNINIFLSRTENYIEKHINAEQQALKINQELEEKVHQRTSALKESNQELLSTLEKLHQFQDQIVETEKMASLGDMVAGVAHEVNTPIGLGVTASTLLSDRLDEIKSAFENKTLKSSQLKRFLHDSEANIGIIYRNLKRAADLISSFKKVAVDQSTADERTFVMSELIEEIILTLGPELKTKPVKINIDCPEDLTIISKPGPINQILINLIINSIIHAFDEKTEGVITLSVIASSGQLHLKYQDNGKGVDSSMKNKIFEPFTTTKRGEGGSGLGLHLVYNLVTQALRGNIHFNAEIEQGIEFNINFPVTIP